MTWRLCVRHAVVFTAAALCVACASSGGSARGAGNVLTNDDLLATHEANAFLAVQRLRPSWLRPRGQTSTTGTTVVTLFVDGSPRGDASNLASLGLDEIATITYLSASEAAFRFGTLAGSGGTVAVSTRR